MKRLCFLAAICLALLGPVRTFSAVPLSPDGELAGGRIADAKTTSSAKKVYVKGYYRKDGTYVPPHYRAAPGGGAGATSGKPPAKSSATPSANPSANTTPASSSNACKTCPRDSKGRIIRSEAAKKEFMKETGFPNGRPGYVVDHIIPLECGGADDPSNMQWQTTANAKAKDKTEGDCRK
jgi:hypothetical protein